MYKKPFQQELLPDVQETEVADQSKEMLGCAAVSDDDSKVLRSQVKSKERVRVRVYDTAKMKTRSGGGICLRPFDRAFASLWHRHNAGLASGMLDLLPKALWSNPKARFIDLFTKNGVLLCEIVKRLDAGLALFLDQKKRLLCPPKVVTTGLVNASMLHARKLFREAFQCGATSLYVVHNHPNGDATPLKENIAMTAILLESSKILGIPLRDHIAVGTENSLGSAFVSICERMKKQ